MRGIFQSLCPVLESPRILVCPEISSEYAGLERPIGPEVLSGHGGLENG